MQLFCIKLTFYTLKLLSANATSEYLTSHPVMEALQTPFHFDSLYTSMNKCDHDISGSDHFENQFAGNGIFEVKSLLLAAARFAISCIIFIL